jgi:ketopantoate reductase
MGAKIAIVGTGAVGGYAGAHMAQAGEDVIFVDFWPENVEAIRTKGLRISHLRDVPEFTTPARALHVTELQTLAKEKPIDMAFVCTKSYDTGWATTMIRQYLAPGGFVVSLQNCMNEETIAGVVGWGKTLGSIASSITVEGRRQARRGPYGIPGRRGAWHRDGPRPRSLPPAWPSGLREGDRQLVGRALVEAHHQRHGQRGFGLDRPHLPRHSAR